MTRNPNCKDCSLHLGLDVNEICKWGSGPKNARIMIIESFPIVHENEPENVILYRAIEDAGLNQNEIYFTNLIKCPTVKNKLPTDWNKTTKLINACNKYLNDEISDINSLYIVLCGAVVLRGFLGIWPITRFVNKEIQENIFCIHSSDYIYKHPDQLEHTINVFKDIKCRLNNNEKASTVSFSHTINTSQQFENMFDSQITEGE